MFPQFGKLWWKVVSYFLGVDAALNFEAHLLSLRKGKVIRVFYFLLVLLKKVKVTDGLNFNPVEIDE